MTAQRRAMASHLLHSTLKKEKVCISLILRKLGCLFKRQTPEVVIEKSPQYKQCDDGIRSHPNKSILSLLRKVSLKL